MRYTILTLALLVFSATNLFAQPDSTFYKVELKDESVLIARVVERDSSHIIFLTRSEVRTDIPLYSIKAMTAIEFDDRGDVFRPDPNNSRLFFMPTGRTIKAGSGYFSDYELFFPAFGVGLTDFLTLWGGTSLFPVADDQLLYVSAKGRIVHTNTVDVSLGYLYTSFGAFDQLDLNLGYAALTTGTKKASITIGAGADLREPGVPIIVVGGEAQVSNSIAFLSENWIPTSDAEVIYSFGLRFFGDNLSADLGFFGVGSSLSSGGFPFVPWLGFAYNWGGTGKP